MITDRSLPSAPLNAFIRWKSPASHFARVSLTMKTRLVPAGFIRPALIAVLASLALVLGSSQVVAQANQSPPERLTYQLQIVETSNVIEFHYCSAVANGGTSGFETGATGFVGIEDVSASDQSIGLGANTAGVISTTQAYRFTPQP